MPADYNTTPATKTTQPEHSEDKRRLWIVEDHESIRELLCSFAREIDTLELVGSSRSAEPMLAAARSEEVDLVILDLMLESQGGLQVLDLLTELPRRPKVIILSGMATIHTVQAAVEWGVAGYVDKSAPLDDLRHAIERSRGDGAYFSSGPSTLIRKFIQRRGNEDGRPALTARDRVIVQKTAQGVHTKRIAEALKLSEPSIYKLKKSIMRKLDVHSDQQLTLCALRMGLIHPSGEDRPKSL